MGYVDQELGGPLFDVEVAHDLSHVVVKALVLFLADVTGDVVLLLL